MILVALAGWTILSAAVLSSALRGKVESRLQARTAAALHADPALAHVDAVFDGLAGVLDGRVGEKSLIDRAEAIARENLPAGRLVENRIDVAKLSPSVLARIEKRVVVLEGQVADAGARDALISAIRKIALVDDVRAEQLLVSGEVRSIAWIPNFAGFLPKFLEVCSDGAAVADDETWILEGVIAGAEQRDEIEEAWRQAKPESAKVIVEGLALAPAAKPKPAAGAPTVAAVAVPEPPKPGTPEVLAPATNPSPPAIESVAPETPPKPPKPAATPEQLDALAAQLAEFAVYFASDSSLLAADDKSKLDNIGKVLSDFEAAFELELIGFADSRGDGDYNRWLGNQRAERVRDHLAEFHDVEVKKIRVEIVKHDAPPSYAVMKNDRRVEIRLIR